MVRIMFAHSTVQNSLGAMLYVLVVLASLAAAAVAQARTRSPSHAGQWAAIGLVFVLLFLSRAFDVEEGLRDALRDGLRADGLYNERRLFQRKLAAGAILLGALMVAGLGYRFRRRMKGRRELALGAAVLATAAMIGLIVLRMISLHQIDALLFGPIKLNWIIDIGTSLLVAFSAVYYARLALSRR